MQVPDEVRKCVVFACYRNREGITQLAGTVFFVVVGASEINYSFGYAVTAKHVIVGIQQNSVDNKVLLRVNMKQGMSQFCETDASNWVFHPEDPCVDVAVMPLWLPRDQIDYLPLPIEMAATDHVIKDQEIGIGDEVFLTGLFVNHVGQQRNLPIVRTGNIALMPEEPVQTKELGPIDAFLVEARSIGGLSGSPVFVYIGASRIVGGSVKLGAASRFYWLGLMHGHFDTEVSERDALSEDIFNKEKVNMGIAIVIPVSKILEVINQEAFVKGRQQFIQEKQKDMLPTADAAQANLTQD